MLMIKKQMLIIVTVSDKQKFVALSVTVKRQCNYAFLKEKG